MLTSNTMSIIADILGYWSSPTTYASVQGLPDDPVQREDMLQRLVLGGESCDYCGTPCSGVDDLKRCSKCELQWYCSKTCQTKDWKEGGHKQDCRRKRLVLNGDVMLLTEQGRFGLLVKGALPQELVRVASRSVDDGKNVIVSKLSDGALLEVEKRQLRHIRASKKWCVKGARRTEERRSNDCLVVVN